MDSGRNKFGTVVKAVFYLSGRNFWENTVFKKTKLFWEIKQKIYGLWAKNLWHAYRNCSLIVQRSHQLNKILTKAEFVAHFDLKGVGVWAQIVNRVVKNCILRVQRNILKKKHFEQNYKFNSSLECERKLFGLSTNFFVAILKTEFYESIENFLFLKKPEQIHYVSCPNEWKTEISTYQ